MKTRLLLALTLTVITARASQAYGDADGDQVTACLAIQTALKPRSEVLLFRTDANQLDQAGHPLRAEWNINICPNCASEIKSRLIFSGAQPGMEASYVNTSGVKFVELHTRLGDPEREQFVLFLKEAGCAVEPSTDAPGYKIEFAGKSDSDCIREATALYLLKGFDLGKASLALLDQSKDETVMDFYRVCRKEITQSTLGKYWNEMLYSVERVGESTGPHSSQEQRSNNATSKPLILPAGVITTDSEVPEKKR